MKTAKFLAMLMAAFALTFTFASCGDDDEPTPKPNGGNQSGMVKIGNETASIKSGKAWNEEAAGGGNQIMIVLEADENGKHSCVEIELRNARIQNGNIPTGEYPYLSRQVQEEGKPYCFVGGEINTVRNKDGEIVSGTMFGAHEGGGKLKVQRSGENYTLAFSGLVGWTMIYKNGSSDYGNFQDGSFTYNGKITIK